MSKVINAEMLQKFTAAALQGLLACGDERNRDEVGEAAVNYAVAAAKALRQYQDSPE